VTSKWVIYRKPTVYVSVIDPLQHYSEPKSLYGVVSFLEPVDKLGGRTLLLEVVRGGLDKALESAKWKVRYRGGLLGMLYR
jgi:hypothetical protein